VIPEIFVLALPAMIRPSSLAAIYTLLSHDARRALLCAYVAGGLAVTVGFGLIVVYLLHGIHLHTGDGHTKGMADIAGGAAALLLGVAILTGRVKPSRTHDAPAAGSRWTSALERHVSLRTATLAGPATHIPGVFYLIALNAIVAHELRAAQGALAVIAYNALWFAVPILALVACIVRPDTARDAVKAVQDWARQHARGLMLLVCFGVGTALVVRGALLV
jgi:hypothetical protein